MMMTDADNTTANADNDNKPPCGFICEAYKLMIRQNVCEMANSLLDYLDMKHVKKLL